MEKIVIVTYVGQYKELDSKKRAGEKVAIRDFEFRSGHEKWKGTALGKAAEETKDMQFDQAPYVVAGTWELREYQNSQGGTNKSNEFVVSSIKPL